MESKANCIPENYSAYPKAKRLNFKKVFVGWLKNLKIEGAEAMSRMK